MLKVLDYVREDRDTRAHAGLDEHLLDASRLLWLTNWHYELEMIHI